VADPQIISLQTTFKGKEGSWPKALLVRPFTVSLAIIAQVPQLHLQVTLSQNSPEISDSVLYQNPGATEIPTQAPTIEKLPNQWFPDFLSLLFLREYFQLLNLQEHTSFPFL